MGDEGKGKIVDFLASDAQIVVRFSGGANAGHTIVLAARSTPCILFPPAFSTRQDRHPRSGMVIDPEALFKELEDLEKKGIDWKGRVLISDRATLCCRATGIWTKKPKRSVQSL